MISEKVSEYCKNPLQYIKDSDNIYDEKEEEKKKIKNLKTIPKNDINISLTKIQEIQNILDFEKVGFQDLITLANNENLEYIVEEDYKYQLEKNYEHFLKNIFKEDFFKKRIIFSFLPYGIKAYVSAIPKIVLNVCGNNIISYNKDNNPEDYKQILKALITVILLQEIIHIIRRENPNEYTTKSTKFDYEGGKSFIYHIFGGYSVLYMDLEFANAILNDNSWKKDSKDLKNQFTRFKDKEDDDIINSLKKKGGIKCYDSTIKQNSVFEDEEDFCCKLTI